MHDICDNSFAVIVLFGYETISVFALENNHQLIVSSPVIS